METGAKILVSIGVLAAVGGVIYYIIQNDSNKSKKDINAQSTNPNPSIKVNDGTKNEEPDKPLEKSNYTGKVFKSKTNNTFKEYKLADQIKDVRQKDGTFKRDIVLEWVKTGGKQDFKDGLPVGEVTVETSRGFYLRTPAGKFVWAPKRLLTA